MAEIKCPMCGKPNPAERDVCQFCEARLKPVTDELSRSQPPIRPGDEPRDVDTGQLESTLPRWLREVREKAREASQDESGEPGVQEEPKQQKNADLLAGLQSQSEGDEEIPDWLSGLRSEGSQIGFEDTSMDDDDMAALRSMLGEEAPASKENEAGALPGWISDQDSGQAEQPDEAQTESQASLSGSDIRWDADFGSESDLPADSAEGEKPFEAEFPSWLQDTDKPQLEESGSELPTWLGTDEPARAEGGSQPAINESGLPAWLQDKLEEPAKEADTSLPAWLGAETPSTSSESRDIEQAGEADMPAWLSSLGEADSAEPAPPMDAEPPVTKSTTDWLASFKEEGVEEEPPQSMDSAVKSTTDWLASLDADTSEVDSQQTPAQPTSGGEMPDWLAALGQESGEFLPGETQPSAESETPDWLASLGEQGAEPEADRFSAAGEAMEPAPAAVEGDFPGWLTGMGDAPVETAGPGEEVDQPISPTDVPAAKPGTAPAFVDDEGKPISNEDIEAIFSMDMPDWLTDARGVPEEATPAAPAPEADELRLAELPSWVQAMRPVESVISESAGAAVEEQPVEQRGPLAGLRGVLPAAAGIGLSSKPKGYSFKLQVSEDQQSSVALLENMLAEEAKPKAVASQKVLLSQRLLRLAITTVFLVIVASIFFSGTGINQIPTSVPPETKAVVDYVQSETGLPVDSPVLMVFDYEAARAGELEAAAAPLVDMMLMKKNPRLTLVSSTPVGPGLAEHFMKIVQTDPAYTRNEKFINLGYLSGGEAGVQAFARNPLTTKQLTTTGENAWSMPAVQGVGQLSNFAAILLLTDDVETARAWIEQTEGVRGEARLLVVSSAQSGPMIQPYVRSGQVDGIISGLKNSAPIEQINSGRPGMARRYWDAYGFGLLTAVVMIATGSLWSLVSGLRASRKEQGEG